MILIPFSIVILRNPKETEAGWWNEGWRYRKAIPVTNNTGAETTVYIDFTGASTIDTSDTVKFQADCELRAGGLGSPYSAEVGPGGGGRAVRVGGFHLRWQDR